MEKEASFEERFVSSYQNQTTVYEEGISDTHWIRYDLLANNDLKKESFDVYSLGYHLSTDIGLDFDLDLWARTIENAVVLPSMDDFINELNNYAELTAVDGVTYYIKASSINASKIEKQGLDAQIFYSTNIEKLRLCLKERFSFIFKDHISYKNGYSTNLLQSKFHPRFRESFNLTLDYSQFRFSFSEYSTSSFKQKYTDEFLSYTRSYDFGFEYRAENLSGGVFVRNVGAENLVEDYSEDVSKVYSDRYSSVRSKMLTLEFKARI